MSRHRIRGSLDRVVETPVLGFAHKLPLALSVETLLRGTDEFSVEHWESSRGDT